MLTTADFIDIGKAAKNAGEEMSISEEGSDCTCEQCCVTVVSLTADDSATGEAVARELERAGYKIVKA